MMDMPVALMVVMISGAYTYPQTHLVVNTKYAQLFRGQSYLNKMVLKTKKKNWGLRQVRIEMKLPYD